MSEEQKHLEHAREKLEQGDYRGAISDLNKAIQLNPGYAIAYGRRAYAKDSLGDRAGAVEDLDKAIAIDPAYDYAYVESPQDIPIIQTFFSSYGNFPCLQ